MLLGIWGPFAIGKTTYLTQFMNSRQGDLGFKRTIIVMADLSQEFRMDVFGQWGSVVRKGDDDHWKGKQSEKEARIRDMVADDRYMWVVESARYFSGMYECLVDAHNLCDGGLRFIIPITDGPTMVKFMQDRCAKRNKAYREDYWVPDRVAYEADKRYTNAAEKWFKPNGIPYEIVHIDESRDTFYRVGGVLECWLKLRPDQWYDMAHSFRVLAGVEEDILLERKLTAERHGRY